MKAAIQVDNLSKEYVVSERRGGLAAAVRGLFRRDHRRIRAVDALQFSVAPGEIVGFLGPNGAGKTTTLKMLSGLLHPSGGDARVLGFQPWRRERGYLGQMALVMGQRNQLIWDIPAMDTFELLRAIYRVPKAEFKATLTELDELLELGALLGKPVRTLSLGERMKCEIAGALIHKPRVLFLDEPTIGLDVTMQRRIRAFVRDYNAEQGATVLLTSHYMADVEALCRRVIVIHHGFPRPRRFRSRCRIRRRATAYDSRISPRYWSAERAGFGCECGSRTLPRSRRDSWRSSRSLTYR